MRCLKTGCRWGGGTVSAFVEQSQSFSSSASSALSSATVAGRTSDMDVARLELDHPCDAGTGVAGCVALYGSVRDRLLRGEQLEEGVVSHEQPVETDDMLDRGESEIDESRESSEWPR